MIDPREAALEVTRLIKSIQGKQIPIKFPSDEIAMTFAAIVERTGTIARALLAVPFPSTDVGDDTSGAGAPPLVSAAGDPLTAYMGTAEQARSALITKVAAWRTYRQPFMGTAAQLRKRDAGEREALFQLGNAAMLWLWHEEEAMRGTLVRAGVDANQQSKTGVGEERS